MKRKSLRISWLASYTLCSVAVLFTHPVLVWLRLYISSYHGPVALSHYTVSVRLINPLSPWTMRDLDITDNSIDLFMTNLNNSTGHSNFLLSFTVHEKVIKSQYYGTSEAKTTVWHSVCSLYLRSLWSNAIVNYLWHLGIRLLETRPDDDFTFSYSIRSVGQLFGGWKKTKHCRENILTDVLLKCIGRSMSLAQ